MKLDDKIFTWQSYSKRVNKLWSGVEDDLEYSFAPYYLEPDEDTPNVRKLFNMLADLSAYISCHLDELENSFNKINSQQEDK